MSAIATLTDTLPVQSGAQKGHVFPAGTRVAVLRKSSATRSIVMVLDGQGYQASVPNTMIAVDK